MTKFRKFSALLRRKFRRSPWQQYSVITSTGPGNKPEKWPNLRKSNFDAFFDDFSWFLIGTNWLRELVVERGSKNHLLKSNPSYCFPAGMEKNIRIVLPPCVQAPSRLTMFLCCPRWLRIFSSDIRASRSSGWALAAPSMQHNTIHSLTGFVKYFCQRKDRSDIFSIWCWLYKDVNCTYWTDLNNDTVVFRSALQLKLHLSHNWWILQASRKLLWPNLYCIKFYSS